jgi:hypothetical protein
MDSTSLETTHDLLLAMAGRVDDDLLAWTRELVAVGEDAHAVEMLTATLTADRVALPAAVRRQLVELAGAARIELDADAELAPADPNDATEHRFAAEESLAGVVANTLAAMPSRQLQDCRVLLTHRRTAAGSAPGPLPHPVLIVEVEPGTRRPDMLSYQLTVALERSGVPASVEVLTVGSALPAYHAEALRSARRLRLDRGAAAGAPARDNRAEATVTVQALPSRRRPDPAPPKPLPEVRTRQAGATQPISAAMPFGTSNSDTPLFDSPALEGRAEEADRAADVAEPVEPRAVGRLTAVPSVFDESFPDESDSRAEERISDDRVGEFHPEEFGRDRRGPAHRIASADDRPEPRPSPRPKPRPIAGQVTPISRTPGAGPTAVPLLRRNGRHPLAPVDAEDGGRENGSSDYDPLHDPLSRPLMAPLLDPTPPLTGPLGLVGGPNERPSAVAEESWSGDWLSGAWAMPQNGEQQPETAAPAEPEKPAPRPVRRAPRHRYLRTQDPIEDDPATDQDSAEGARSGDVADVRSPSGAIPMGPPSGAIPLPPATGAIPLPPATGAIPLPPAGVSSSGAIPLPPATTGGVPQTPTRPAIPMPAAESRDPAGPPELPDVDPSLGLRPESLARLGEADLDLLAKLQAELRGERRSHTDFAGSSTPADGLPVGSGANGHANGHRYNGHGPNGHGSNGHSNGYGANGHSSNGHETNGHSNGSATGTDQEESERNGPSRHGTGQRRGPFGRRRAERADQDGDGNPPDIAG